MRYFALMLFLFACCVYVQITRPHPKGTQHPQVTTTPDTLYPYVDSVTMTLQFKPKEQ
jgi:hypothetical protein